MGKSKGESVTKTVALVAACPKQKPIYFRCDLKDAYHTLSYAIKLRDPYSAESIAERNLAQELDVPSELFANRPWANKN